MRPIDKDALITLKVLRSRLSWQQYCTLKGQILSGDADGAMKGLMRLLRRRAGGESACG